MKEFIDEDLGRIVVITNKRCQRIIARRKSDYFQLTVPAGLNRKDILEAVSSMKSRLINLKSKPALLITDDTTFQTLTFKFEIQRTNILNSYKIFLKNNILTVNIPENVDINSVEAQSIIKTLTRNALRTEAKNVLPRKLKELAQKHNIPYNNVKINSSITRWGSCSLQKNINLSFYLLFLPEKYIDYVILHELTHTFEMNHGENFWKLLCKFCGEDAKKLRHGLKQSVPDAYYLFAEKGTSKR